MGKVDGGELLARTLERAGVKEVFGLQGGHLDSFLMACDGHGIRLTDTRHERPRDMQRMVMPGLPAISASR